MLLPIAYLLVLDSFKEINPERFCLVACAGLQAILGQKEEQTNAK